MTTVTDKARRKPGREGDGRSCGPIDAAARPDRGPTVARLPPGLPSELAQALGLADRGTLTPGLRADLAIWDAETPAELIYCLGERRLHARIHGGRWC